MFKKLNTGVLLAVFAILAVIVLFNKFYQTPKEESTFNPEFLKLDTATITSILIYPKAEQGKEIKFTKNGSRWNLEKDNIKTIADSNAVRGLLGLFINIKSVSLAGQDKSSWKDLQVTDSSGTRVKIITNDKTYDLMVGKFGYNSSSRNGLTYIRHTKDETVYAIEGFMALSVNQGFEAWRNKTFINGSYNNWTSLTFTYPGDSSFQLSKNNNTWLINGLPVDSTKTTQYLNEISNLQGSGFVDGLTSNSAPVFTLNINGNNQSPITVTAYPSDTAQRYILHSSLNPEANFRDDQSNLVNRIFKGKTNFIK